MTTTTTTFDPLVEATIIETLYVLRLWLTDSLPLVGAADQALADLEAAAPRLNGYRLPPAHVPPLWGIVTHPRLVQAAQELPRTPKGRQLYTLLCLAVGLALGEALATYQRERPELE